MRLLRINWESWDWYLCASFSLFTRLQVWKNTSLAIKLNLIKYSLILQLYMFWFCICFCLVFVFLAYSSWFMTHWITDLHLPLQGSCKLTCIFCFLDFLCFLALGKIRHFVILFVFKWKYTFRKCWSFIQWFAEWKSFLTISSAAESFILIRYFQ